MELARSLWRWSTAVQLSSVVMITVFFVLLARSVRLAELRYWVRAWTCGLLALVVTLIFWYLDLQGALYFAVARAAYMGLKCAFVVLLVQGALALKRPGATLLSPAATASALGAYAIFGALLPDSVEVLGAVHHGVMTVLFGAGALLLVRPPVEPALSWLVGGLLLRALLCAVEAAAYATQLLPQGSLPPGLAQQAGIFLAAHSSFDSGAEWLLALGCVFALSERAQRELRLVNLDLLTAQEDLRRLADRDPLTALHNRRSLPEVFRAVQPSGATLLFFDLDGFKQINDLHGHQVGDECLRRFAGALRDSFRPTDAVVRYAGDEFLVIASGLDHASIDGRLGDLRARVGQGGMPLRFSVGQADLPPGGRPESALEAADEAMYSAKAGRPGTRA